MKLLQDAKTRAAVSHNLDNARRTGDTNATIVLLAQLIGPCCLPPATPPPTATPPAATGSEPHPPTATDGERP